MEVKTFSVEGPKLITLKKFGDDRGFFCERFRRDVFEKNGLPFNFIQENYSRSGFAVTRGLHYQWEGPQGKLVGCFRGHIFDVAVDIRRDSPTFGKSVSVELKCDEPAWFWVPAGFAHGFQVLSETGADVAYKVDHYYNPANEGAIRWNDPTLNIPWPLKDPVLSGKDAVAGDFEVYTRSPRF